MGALGRASLSIEVFRVRYRPGQYERIEDMENRFEKWKNFILNNEERLSGGEATGMADVVIDKVHVTVYSAPFLYNAGMWLQSSDWRIRLYQKHDFSERIIRRTFNEKTTDGPVHQHDSIEIGYVVEGTAKQRMMGKEHLFQAGDFWIIDRNCYHSDVYENKDLFMVTIGVATEIFDSAFVQNIGEPNLQKFLSLALKEQKQNYQFLHFRPKHQNAGGGVVMERFLSELVHREVGYKDIAKGLLARLFSSLVMEYEFTMNGMERDKVNELVCAEIEQYIKDHYQTVTVAELKEQFHYHGDYYNRILKRYTGKSFVEYLTDVRVDKSVHFLRETDLSVEEISAEIGYTGQTGFYKIFKNRYGMTPGKFRVFYASA